MNKAPRAPKTITIALPQLPDPELFENALRHNGHDWRAGKRLRDSQRQVWWGLILEYFDGQTIPKVDGPFTLEIALTGTGQRRDPDGWAASMGIKVLIDVLTELGGLGIIKDDSPRYVKRYAVSVEPDGEPQTIITIRSVSQ